MQVITAAALVVSATGWRLQRWRTLWLPLALIVAVLLALWAHWYIASEGLAGEPAPWALSIWIGLTGMAVAVLLVGSRRARWWQRGAAVLAVPLCLLCAGLALNGWVGYFPTLRSVWNQLTGGTLPNQTDQATVTAMQLKGGVPTKGVVVPVNISSAASNFKHRGELVYLPPAWFATKPPPRLPVVMMIGAEFNTPADWLRAGNAVSTADSFAATQGGIAPVLVFVDSGGAFNIGTECVNGPAGTQPII
jgi:S-formylglutathione hydrolase FrmB